MVHNVSSDQCRTPPQTNRPSLGMNNRLEIDTKTVKSLEISPTTVTNDLLPIEKNDRMIKSVSSDLMLLPSPNTSATPNTSVNDQPPIMQRQPSFSKQSALQSSFTRKPSFGENDIPLVDISNVLHNLTFFSGLPSSDAFIKDITGLMKLRPFKAGDTVIQYGDVAKCMYLIVRGELGIISEDNEIEYATLTAGSFVGEIGVLFNTVRSATVVCKTKSLLVALTSEDIQAKLDIYPEIKDHIHLKGAERLQAIENIKNNNKSDVEGEERRGKAGFNVKRSSSFRKNQIPSSAPASPVINVPAGPTVGLLTPDSMNVMKNRASSRRSSLNPDAALGVQLDSGPNNEPAFVRRKSFVMQQDDDQTKLNKTFNASRRMSSIRFQLEDLAVPAPEAGFTDISITVPQIDVSSSSEFELPEQIPTIDIVLPTIDIVLPTIDIVDENQGIKEDNIALPAIMIDASSIPSLEEEKNESFTIPVIITESPAINDMPQEDVEQLKCKETEPRRISVAVWSDPTLVKMSHKKEETIAQSQKQGKVWTSIQAEDITEDTTQVGLQDKDDDEMNFLKTSLLDLCDQEFKSITNTEDVLFHLVNYLSFEDIFKIRGICLNMPTIISEAKPRKFHNIDLSPYFRRLNDRGLIAISKLCGDLIEKINLHAAYQLTDRSIQKLAKLSPNLNYLNVSEVWEFSDASLTALSSYCPFLVHIDLSNCRKITNRGLLGLLESCPKLSILSLSYCKNLTNKVFDHEGWTRIKALNLHRCTGIGDRGFEFWPLFTDDLEWAGGGSRQLASSTDWALASDDNIKGSFYKSSNLEDFNATDGNNKCEEIISYGNGLIFKGNSFDFTDSSENPRIMVEELSETTSDASRFALKMLDLRDCSFLSDTAIASIASVCCELRVLNLSFCCSLSEDFGRYLVKGCKKLSQLDVSFCGGAVTNEFVLEISAGLHQLTALSIRGCIQVTDDGVDHIIKYSNLTKINYTQCKGISSRGREALSKKYEIIETITVCDQIAKWEP